jgi:hypothetical protein
MWINLHAVFLIFACLLLLGCGPPDRGPSEVVRLDSAGVTMVSNPDVALPEWTVDSILVADATLPRLTLFTSADVRPNDPAGGAGGSGAKALGSAQQIRCRMEPAICTKRISPDP